MAITSVDSTTAATARLHCSCCLLLFLSTTAHASDTVTPPLQCGDDEREYGAGACPLETKFTAVLTVRKTGYSGELTPDTVLDEVFPSPANVDLSFEVAAAVQGLVDAGAEQAGSLLAGVCSEVGYEDRISVGGTAYAVPPRLVVVYEGTVPTSAGSWSSVKAAYR